MEATAPIGVTAAAAPKPRASFIFRRKPAFVELQRLVQALPQCHDVAEALRCHRTGVRRFDRITIGNYFGSR